MTLAQLLATLPERPDAAELLGGLVPPARFAGKRFDDYDPRNESQAAAAARLEALAGELRAAAEGGWVRRLRARLAGAPRGGNLYLDGGFGVGKTHLLAALWNAAPAPKLYLSFDELCDVHFRLREMPELRDRLGRMRLVAVDEWELDDPANLRVAISMLRLLLEGGATVVATSNTLPLDLGAGRFNQKDFGTEIGELAGAFEVVTLRGEDFRHRHFEAHPGHGYFLDDDELLRWVGARERVVCTDFASLTAALAGIHPLRFRELVARMRGLAVRDVLPIGSLPEAIRWVHFVDDVYDQDLPFAASAGIDLGDLFPAGFLAGPYAKKCSRCLSRMEEMLGAIAPAPGAASRAS